MNDKELLSAVPYTSAECGLLLELFAAVNTSFRVRDCYMNAFVLTDEASELACERAGILVEYAEGIGRYPGNTASHAVMALNGKPVDVTWREETNGGDWVCSPAKLLSRAQHCLSHFSYEMTRLAPDATRRMMSARRRYESILDSASP
jgi:hypothetical protein